MNILALETSTNACSVAVFAAGQNYSLMKVEPQIHAKVILNMVDQILDEAGIILDQVDAIAYGQGPGSFTGLRITASVVQGLAFGANLPVIAVSSLQALAQQGYNVLGATDILAKIDARMGEIYWGAYRVASDGLVVTVETDRVAAQINIDLKDYTQVGMDHTQVIFPRAEEIAQLAIPMFARGETIDPSGVIPVYIRNDVVQTGKKNPD